MTVGINMALPLIGVDLPDVQECYGGHRTKSAICLFGDVSSCAQCDGRHAHQWVECRTPHGEHARRCSVCGGRQCDAECVERRHHRGPHLSPSGEFSQVGT